jgi:DNA-binding transcriptional regulator YiaG
MNATLEIELIAEARAAVRTGHGISIRRSLELSRAEIARACRVDYATMWRWETGLQTPRADAAKRYGLLLRRLHEMDAARSESLTRTSPAGSDPALLA